MKKLLCVLLMFFAVTSSFAFGEKEFSRVIKQACREQNYGLGELAYQCRNFSWTGEERLFGSCFVAMCIQAEIHKDFESALYCAEADVVKKIGYSPFPELDFEHCSPAKFKRVYLNNKAVREICRKQLDILEKEMAKCIDK